MARNKERIGVILKHELNRLARGFYMLQGYTVEEGYDFSTATHPQERLMWQQARLSWEFWMKERI